VPNEIGCARPEAGKQRDTVSGEAMSLEIVDDEGVACGRYFVQKINYLVVFKVVKEQAGMKQHAWWTLPHRIPKIAELPANARMGVPFLCKVQAVRFEVPTLHFHQLRELWQQFVEGIAPATTNIDKGMEVKMWL